MGTTKEAEKNNVTTLFLLRPLGIIKKEETISSSRMSGFGFIQAYVSDMRSPELYIEYPIYILFKQKNFTSTFEEFVDEEYDRGILRADYDYPEGYVVLVYSFPQFFRADYDKILKGQYSKTSKEYKELFPMESKLPSGTYKSFYYNIFNKAEEWKKEVEELVGQEFEDDWEVYSSPYMEKESLDISKYIPTYEPSKE